MTPERLRLRAVAALGLVLCAFALLAVRLAWLQLAAAPAMARAAQGQHFGRREPVQAERGRILDRNGQVLAVTEKFPSLAVDPQVAAQGDAALLASLVEREIGIPASQVTAAVAHGGRFRWLKRQVADRPAVERLRRELDAAKVAGLIVREEPRRVYPLGARAAHVLGFTDRDGRGLEGMEALHNRSLGGLDGWRTTLRDAAGNKILTADDGGLRPVDGEDLRLTLNATIQAFAEQEANDTWVQSHADGVIAVVVDIETGDILGVACRPTFDPNDPSHAEPAQRRNRFVTDSFEPGSVFKPIVMAAALEAGTTSLGASIDTEGGRLRLGGRVIHEDRNKDYGVLTPTEAIAHSSNVAMAKIGIALGADRLKGALRLFGFGTRTALRWPGEQPGDIQASKKWSVSDQLASISFGHSMTATSAQLVQAYATIAAGGLRRELRLRADAPETAPVRVLSEGTAQALLPMLEAVLGPGGTAEHTKRQCPEFRVGGKTGTAQKLQTGGHVSSFACVGPLEAPRLAVLVLVDEPKKGSYGSVVAAPFALRILRSSLHYLGVEPAAAVMPYRTAAQGRLVTPEVAPR